MTDKNSILVRSRKSHKKASSAYSTASSLFPDMRSFTPEEQRKYTQAINKVYKPTGMKLW